MSKKIQGVPEYRFKGYTDDWEQRKLGDFLEYEQPTSYIVSSTDYDDAYTTPVLTAGQSFILGYTSENKNIKDASNSNPIIIFDDFTTGSHYVNFPFKVKSSAMKLLFSKDDSNDFYFIYYMLKNINYEPKNHMRHWITIFSKFKVCAPNVQEQEIIGNCMRSIDHLITLHQRKLDQLSETKRYFLNKMFPNKDSVIPELRFKGYTDDWEQRKLGEMGKTFTGLSGKTKDDFGHGEAEFVTYMNVFSNSISNIDQTENVEIDDRQNKIQYGDIFFTTSSETPEEVGMSSVWLGHRPNVYLNSFCFGYRSTEILDHYYMAYMLRSPEVRRSFQLLAQGTSRYNISKTKVMDISVFIPKIEEQVPIGQFFINLDHLITLHQRELEILGKIKKTLLNKMFV